MIDAEFNYKADLGNKDPDRYSRKLKEDHKELWSKQLPDKRHLQLMIEKGKLIGYVDGTPLFDFNPDSCVNGYSRSKKYGSIINEWRNNAEIKEELAKYEQRGYVISESIIFPLKDDNNSSKWTINRARGCLYPIQDRTDLTLECIRRYYEGNEDSPLKSCLVRYSKFFALFGSSREGFINYVNFFLLNDLVTDNYSKVVNFTSSLDFAHPFPETEEEYLKYIKSINSFVANRSARIINYISKNNNK